MGVVSTTSQHIFLGAGTLWKGGGTGTVSGNTAANPTVVTESAAHGLTTGDSVTFTGSNSTPVLAGPYAVTVLSSTTYSVPVTVTVPGTAGTRTKNPSEVGATDDNGIWRVNRTYNAPTLNGVVGKLINTDFIVSEIAQIEATVVELSTQKLALGFPGSVITADQPSSGDSTLDPGSQTTRRLQAVDYDLWQYRIAGLATRELRFQITNGAVQNNPEVTAADDGNSFLHLMIESRVDPANPNKVWKIIRINNS